MFVCLKCYKSLSSKQRLQEHLKKSLPCDLCCRICNEQFGTKYRYYKHVKTMHNDNVVKDIEPLKLEPISNDNSIQTHSPKRKKHKRITIRQEQRTYIAAEQGWTCKRCSEMFGKAGWHINHIIRVALGGTNERYNLEAICHTCHIIITAEERIRDGF